MKLALVRATLLRRYKRFLADVRLADGTQIVAHVPNTGSMATLLSPGHECPCWLAPAADPARKLRWTVVLLQVGQNDVAVVDTGLPNRLVAEAITAGAIPELAGYSHLRREVAYGSRNSRADVALTDHPTRPPAVVEVKNVTYLAGPGLAAFPDAVTERGLKHLHELADEARAGRRAIQFYLVDRTDCTSCGVASAIDPAYAAAAAEAAAAGVEFLAYRVAVAMPAGPAGEVDIALGQRVTFSLQTVEPQRRRDAEV